MAILIILVGIIGLTGVGAAIYGAATLPCENGFHRYRHWRFKRFRPGGCSAVD